MRIFLSYDFRTNGALATELTSALIERRFDVWQDQRSRSSVRRWIGRKLRLEGELGIDAWLREGILDSDVIVALLPYDRRPDHFPETWELVRPSTANEMLRWIGEESSDLEQSYSRKASAQWDDPKYLDRAGWYLLRPIHSYRMAWYEKHYGIPLGKDHFEHWRRWEMRIAGAAALKVVLVVPVDPREDRFAEAVEMGLPQYPPMVIVRGTALRSDVIEKVVPAIERAAPTSQEAAEMKHRRQELHRLRARARATLILYAAIATGLVVIGVLLAYKVLTTIF